MTFFSNLQPGFLRRNGDLARLKALLQKYETSDKTLFIKLLKEAIHKIEELISINPN